MQALVESIIVSGPSFLPHRLDTDIAMGLAGGLRTVLTLTGVASFQESGGAMDDLSVCLAPANPLGTNGSCESL